MWTFKCIRNVISIILAVLLMLFLALMSAVCSWSCFGREHAASFLASKYVVCDFSVDHLVMSLWIVACSVAWSMCLKWTSCGPSKKLLAYLLLHFWPLVWIFWQYLVLPYFYSCVPITYNYQHASLWYMISFFLDTYIKAFNFIFFSL